jgi:hypothetical protein
MHRAFPISADYPTKTAWHEARRRLDVADHHGDVWWEKYTRRLRYLAHPHFGPIYWYTKMQDATWWFPSESGSRDGCGRNLLWNLGFAEYIIDRIAQNLEYPKSETGERCWLDE